jgi:shikimate kinase
LRGSFGSPAFVYTAAVKGRNTVWLVGMMGAGKSAVGRSLARALGVRFVDSDEEVVRRSGCSVNEIFEREGEQGFRTREREWIETLAGEEAIVSLGGGAVSQPGAVDRLAATGTLVYLRARPETLLARIGDARDRPLLAGLDAPAREACLAELIEARDSANEAAAIIVDTDDLAVDEVAVRVARRLAGLEGSIGNSEGA